MNESIICKTRMVNFATSDIPPNITTVEQLHCWCSLVLTNLHFQMEITEAPNVVEKVAVAQTFPINQNGTYKSRFVGRGSFEINNNYQQGGKLWAHILPLSNASIPNDFKSA